MRQTILAAVAAFVIGGVTAGAVMSYAQPASPPPPGPPGASAAWHGPGPMRGRRAMWRHRAFRPGAFALVYTQPDRHLTPDDVHKIAEGFLLWHGNHDWKVVDVAATSDGAIDFSLATQSGSVIAKFSMDPHTGRVTRLG